MNKISKEKIKKIGSTVNRNFHRLIYGLIALAVCGALYNFSRSDVAFQFSLYENDNGKTEILKIDGKRNLPDTINKNIIDLNYKINGGRGFGYKRHIGKLPFIGIDGYVGGNIYIDPNGSRTYGIGISIGL